MKSTKNFIRSKKHLQFISTKPCVLCGATNVQSAHIRFAGAGMGLKPCDSFVVPMCIEHHTEQHRMNERLFWKLYDKDPIVFAFFFCLQSPDKKIKSNAFDKFRSHFEK